jgi:hypothetical protein
MKNGAAAKHANQREKVKDQTRNLNSDPSKSATSAVSSGAGPLFLILTTNGATGMSDVEGKAARVAASEAGAERVSMDTNRHESLL